MNTDSEFERLASGRRKLVISNAISLLTNIGALCFIWWLSHASQKTHNQMAETVDAQHATIMELHDKLDKSADELRSEEAFNITQMERAVKAEQKAAELETKLLTSPKGKAP